MSPCMLKTIELQRMRPDWVEEDALFFSACVKDTLPEPALICRTGRLCIKSMHAMIALYLPLVPSNMHACAPAGHGQVDSRRVHREGRVTL